MGNANPTPNLGNLKPYEPGQSGNPGGRPNFSAISKALRGRLTDPIDDETRSMLSKALGIPEDQLVEGTTPAEVIAYKAIWDAMLGDHKAREWVTDRAEGKAIQQQVDHTTEGRPLRVLEQYDDAALARRLLQTRPIWDSDSPVQ